MLAATRRLGGALGQRPPVDPDFDADPRPVVEQVVEEPAKLRLVAPLEVPTEGLGFFGQRLAEALGIVVGEGCLALPENVQHPGQGGAALQVGLEDE